MILNAFHLTTHRKAVQVGKNNIFTKLLDEKGYFLLDCGTADAQAEFLQADISIN